MREVVVKMVPRASGEPVEQKAPIPEPQPRALQFLAAIILVALTAALIVLLFKDPSTVATVVISFILLITVFILLLWVAAVLRLGVGPAQIIALVKAVAGALKQSKEKQGSTPQPAQPQPSPN